MTYEKLREEWINFKETNKIPEEYFLKQADARIGRKVAVMKRIDPNGTIQLASGRFFTFSEFKAYMDGYYNAKQKIYK